METPSTRGPRSLPEFCRDLGSLRRQCGTKLDLLSRLPGSRGTSQLSEIFSGKVRLPPDRDLVALLVGHLLARARARHVDLPPGLPTTPEAWLDRFDAAVLRWEREHIDAVPPDELPDIKAPFMVHVKPGFVGRSFELSRLDDALSRNRRSWQRPVVISALAGTAGVGKTALAERWADLARESFPHGVLYVNLRGFHAQERVKPRDAVALLLRELGISRRRIPYSLSDRMELFERALAGRSVLVIYDNAADSAHVRPLLLKKSTCFILVTSRDSMQDLVTENGATRIEIDRMSLAQSIDLLKVHIQPEVVIEEQDFVDLAEACVRLPLALRVAAETLNKFPQRPVTDLLGHLQDERRKLDVFDRRDPDRALRTLFSWSYAYLTDEEAATFRAVGLHLGTGEVDPYSIAAFLDVGSYEASRYLDLLCRSYLVESARSGRYEMHDLLRVYARELGEQRDSVEARRAGLDRLTRYYLFTTSRAMDIVAPYEADRRPVIERPPVEIPDLPSPDEGHKWLRAERSNLVSAAQLSIETNSSASVVTLSLLVFRFLDSQALYDVALLLHGHAVRALRDRGDRDALGLALRHLGVTQERVGQNAAAAQSLAEALELARLADDRSLVCYALNSLGLIYYRLGRNLESVSLLEEAIEIGDALGDGELLGTAHRNIAFAYWRLGRYEAAGQAMEHANAIAMTVGDDTLLAYTLTNLGLTYWRSGRAEEAMECQRMALRAAERAGTEAVAGYAMTNLGLLLWRSGQYEESLKLQERAMERTRLIEHLSLRAYVTMNLGLSCWKTGDITRALELLSTSTTIAQQIGDKGVATEAFNSLGEVARSAGHREAALKYHEKALLLSGETGDRFEEARSTEGIGMCYFTSSEPEEATNWLDRCNELYSELNDPRAEVIKALRNE